MVNAAFASDVRVGSNSAAAVSETPEISDLSTHVGERRMLGRSQVGRAGGSEGVNPGRVTSLKAA